MPRIVPLHKDLHRDLRVDPEADFTMVESQHMLPLVIHEFFSASAELPIVFVKNSDTGRFQPVLLLGFRSQENLYMDANGWLGLFTPGCIRNQPFKLVSNSEDSEQMMIAVDETSALVGTGKGQRLFEDNGDESAYLQGRKQDLVQYFESEGITRGFVDKLAGEELLLRQNLVVDIGGDKVEIEGLYTVDEKRLNLLPEATFIDFRKRGFLPVIYAHLISLQQIRRLAQHKPG